MLRTVRRKLGSVGSRFRRCAVFFNGRKPDGVRQGEGDRAEG